MAWYGVRRRSLDHSGGIAAIVVGFVLTLASGCFCVSLLVFFFTSSRLTRWRGREKEKFEEDHEKGVELRSVYHLYANVYCASRLDPQIFPNMDRFMLSQQDNIP